MSKSMQVIVDEHAKVAQDQRSKTQMTLGNLIKRLEELDPALIIKGVRADVGSYRGYYCDLYVEKCASDDEGVPASELLKACRNAVDLTFYGYKGGEYRMGESTPLWLASYGCTGNKIMSITTSGEIIVKEDDM